MNVRHNGMRVSVAWGPADEFMISLLAYLTKSRHATLDLGTPWVCGLRLPTEWKTMVAKVRRENLPVGFALGRMVADLRPDGRGAEDFIERVSMAGPEDVGSLLAVDMTARSGLRLARSVHRLLKPLVDGWHRHYFVSMDCAVLDQLRTESIRRREEICRTDLGAAVDEATGGLEFAQRPGTSEVVLSPQQHFRPWNLFDRHRGRILCWYPSPYVPAEGDDPPRELTRLMKALSDANRLRILRMLSSRELTFTDLVEGTGLAKSTVHHHVVILRTAGLLRIRVGWEIGDRLSLRPGMPQRTRRLLASYLASPGNDPVL